MRSGFDPFPIPPHGFFPRTRQPDWGGGWPLVLMAVWLAAIAPASDSTAKEREPAGERPVWLRSRSKPSSSPIAVATRYGWICCQVI